MAAPIVESRVSIAPPEPNATGDMTFWFAKLEQNIRVYNPSGYNTFVTGSTAPTSDQGPWLKDGTQWYVWDPNELDYVPQYLNDAYARDITDGTTLPAGATGSGLFFLTIAGVGRILFRWDGAAWQPVGQLAGTTSQRPTSPPAWTRYWDTTISCEIIYKAGVGWITVSGTYGDIKHVFHADETTALTYNPGWEVAAVVKGRVLVGANGDANGFTAHAPGSTFGTELFTLTRDYLPAVPYTFTYAGTFGQPLGTGVWDTVADGGNDISVVASAVNLPLAGQSGISTTQGNATRDLRGAVPDIYNFPNLGTGTAIPMSPPAIAYIALRKIQ